MPYSTGVSLESFALNFVSISLSLCCQRYWILDTENLQVIYIGGFPLDPIRNKLFVYTVFTLEVVQTIILTKSYFDVFGYGFGQPAAYDHIGDIWFSVPFLSGVGRCHLRYCSIFIILIISIFLVAFLAEIFYAMRLHRLSQSMVVPIVVCMVSFLW